MGVKEVQQVLGSPLYPSLAKAALHWDLVTTHLKKRFPVPLFLKRKCTIWAGVLNSYSCLFLELMGSESMELLRATRQIWQPLGEAAECSVTRVHQQQHQRKKLKVIRRSPKCSMMLMLLPFRHPCKVGVASKRQNSQTARNWEVDIHSSSSQVTEQNESRGVTQSEEPQGLRARSIFQTKGS